MALYLCKMDPETTIAGEPRFVGILGRVVESQGGYRFLSNVSNHKDSRKVWPSATACIPRWTNGCGFTRLLDKQELERARAVLAKAKA